MHIQALVVQLALLLEMYNQVVDGVERVVMLVAELPSFTNRCLAEPDLCMVQHRALGSQQYGRSPNQPPSRARSAAPNLRSPAKARALDLRVLPAASHNTVHPATDPDSDERHLPLLFEQPSQIVDGSEYVGMLVAQLLPHAGQCLAIQGLCLVQLALLLG